MSAAPKTPVRPAPWHPSVPDPAECQRRAGRLTPRQRQILEYMARGWEQQEVARQLGVSTKTVYNTLWMAFEVLGARPAQAALAVFQRAAEAPTAEVVQIRRRSDFGSRRAS